MTFGGFTLRRNIAGAGHECVCSVADVIFIKCVGKCLANFGGCAFSSVADLHTRKLNRCSIYRGIKTPCHIRRNFGPKFGNFAQADLPSINDSFDRACAEINDGSEDVLHNVGKFIPNNLNRVECADPTCDYEINVTLRKFYDNVSNVAELFAPTFRFAIYPINRRIPNAFNPFSGNARSIANISEGGSEHIFKRNGFIGGNCDFVAEYGNRGSCCGNAHNKQADGVCSKRGGKGPNSGSRRTDSRNQRRAERDQQRSPGNRGGYGKRLHIFGKEDNYFRNAGSNTQLFVNFAERLRRVVFKNRHCLRQCGHSFSKFFINALCGIVESIDHNLRGNLALRGKLQQFAARNAQAFSDCVGCIRHKFHYRTEFVAVQLAFVERLRKLQQCRTRFVGSCARNDKHFINSFGKPQRIFLRLAKVFQCHIEARECLRCFLNRRAGTIRRFEQAIRNFINLFCAIRYVLQFVLQYCISIGA